MPWAVGQAPKLTERTQDAPNSWGSLLRGLRGAQLQLPSQGQVAEHLGGPFSSLNANAAGPVKWESHKMASFGRPSIWPCQAFWCSCVVWLLLHSSWFSRCFARGLLFTGSLVVRPNEHIHTMDSLLACMKWLGTNAAMVIWTYVGRRVQHILCPCGRSHG